MASPSGLDILDPEWPAVRWVRDELAPEDVPSLAVEAMTRGCDSPSLRVLAGITGRPTLPMSISTSRPASESST